MIDKQSTDPYDVWTVSVEADTSDLESQLQRVSVLSQRMGRNLSSAFANIAVKGAKVGDVMRGLAQQIARMALRTAFQPLENVFTSFLQGMMGARGFAKGGAFNGGTPVPFAAGGVVAAPTYFPMTSGQTGVMGEAGPEAILPLARGADGRLGVAANGANAPVALTLNISTPDVEGFHRSQTQVAAMMSRMLALGQRNLLTYRIRRCMALPGELHGISRCQISDRDFARSHGRARTAYGCCCAGLWP